MSKREKEKISKNEERKRVKLSFLLSFFNEGEDFKIVNGFVLRKRYDEIKEQYWIMITKQLLDIK